MMMMMIAHKERDACFGSLSFYGNNGTLGFGFETCLNHSLDLASRSEVVTSQRKRATGIRHMCRRDYSGTSGSDELILVGAISE
jgi:hypothetical protein